VHYLPSLGFIINYQIGEGKMTKHLRKLFSTDEVKNVFERYLSREIGVEESLALLKIRRRQFFKLLKNYRDKPEAFSLDYKRTTAPHKIDDRSEAKILRELEKDAAIIRGKNNPVKFYNYSYLKEILEKKHKVVVSLPTIIARAKKMGFIRKRNPGNRMTGKS
jgi:hypothetical protein